MFSLIMIEGYKFTVSQMLDLVNGEGGRSGTRLWQGGIEVGAGFVP